MVVTDQHAFAGALAAERHGIPWATFCTSTIELGRPFAKLPKAAAWIRGHLATLIAEAGLDDSSQAIDLRFSPYLVIVFSSGYLLEAQDFPGHFALVGPALSNRPATVAFPWDRLDPARRHVLVTVGTMADADAMDFYPRAVEALRPLGDSVQAIVLAPPEALPGVPEHIMAIERIPQLELLPHMDAVVCHGGLNTVSETLSNAVPLVVAPLTRDQPINAANVVRVGAGIRSTFTGCGRTNCAPPCLPCSATRPTGRRPEWCATPSPRRAARRRPRRALSGWRRGPSRRSAPGISYCPAFSGWPR